MRYQVPQYLEVEDKIFGPFTLKQFLFAAGGVGGVYAMWVALPQPLGFIGAAVVGLSAAALGFGQMNGRPFLVMIESMIAYAFSRKLYLWRKTPHAATAEAKDAGTSSTVVAVPRLSDSKLKELSWGLDIQETINSRDAMAEEPPAPGDRHRIPTLPPGIF